jgi:hypothetical protein
MKLLFPQATQVFNNFFTEMIANSLAQSFLNKSFESYDMHNIDEVIIILLENQSIENYLHEYLSDSELIKKYKLILLKKETSGSICTSLMAVSHLHGESVIISALDQLLFDKNIQHKAYIEDNINFDIIAPIHNSEDKMLCYALKDEDGQVIQLFEKKAISQDAILGVYIIKNFSDFLMHCHELLIKYKGFKNRVFYTSDVINNFMAKRCECYFPAINVKYYKIRSLEDFRNIL